MGRPKKIKEEVEEIKPKKVRKTKVEPVEPVEPADEKALGVEEMPLGDYQEPRGLTVGHKKIISSKKVMQNGVELNEVYAEDGTIYLMTDNDLSYSI
jgi:hypothetical protein